MGLLYALRGGFEITWVNRRPVGRPTVALQQPPSAAKARRTRISSRTINGLARFEPRHRPKSAAQWSAPARSNFMS